MDPGKVKGISEWPSPTTVKQTWGFLGFRNFYRRFIHHFSEIAKPLNDLLKKDQKFEWTTDCQKAFEELKKTLHRRTSLNYAQPYKTISDRMQHIQICVGSNPDPVGFKWRSSSMCVYLQNLLPRWKKLRNLWSRTIGNHPSTGRMVSLYSRISPYDDNPFGLQKFDILSRSMKI